MSGHDDGWWALEVAIATTVGILVMCVLLWVFVR